MRMAGAFLLGAFLLVAAGSVLYVTDSIGWAQWCWVMASGVAGAGVVLLVEGDD